METNKDKITIRILIAAHVLFCLFAFFKWTDEGKSIVEKIVSVKGVGIVVIKD